MCAQTNEISMMENLKDNLQSGEKNLPISTLIFMDVEATGLPSFLGKQNVHITEITLIAIDRSDFENDKNQRVLNKLSLCVRPRAQISPGAMSITGLYNDMLENQEQFDETVPKLLKYFFRRLRPPICLLAHNGRRYDFPLLQAELKRISYSLGPGVFCGDTLEALRSIINSPPIPIGTKINNVVLIPSESSYTCSINKENVDVENQNNATAEAQINVSVNPANIVTKTSKNVSNDATVAAWNSPSSDQDIEDLLLEDMDIFADIDKKLCDIEMESTKSIYTDIAKTSETNKEKLSDKDNIAYRNEHTPTGKSTVPDDKGLKRCKKPISDPTFSPKKQYKSDGYIHSEARRRLFENGTNSRTPKFIAKPQKMSFSLPKLYHHFFGEDPPQSHYAEADCITLSKVCQQVCSEFLHWIDENRFPFDKIKEMW
ncbi:uncharacterized protein [Parasteatoda tepidariorum]|uniref:uncharacterized protein isoform X2 n=1 Tax=Parasteatoda tepidariorum TaxID=114398 RepID=UPI001C723877|nr:uncharacterized protein LOC107457102 isoform X1 [Parasteatoda tepidariorum]